MFKKLFGKGLPRKSEGDYANVHTPAKSENNSQPVKTTEQYVNVQIPSKSETNSTAQRNSEPIYQNVQHLPSPTGGPPPYSIVEQKLKQSPTKTTQANSTPEHRPQYSGSYAVRSPSRDQIQIEHTRENSVYDNQHKDPVNNHNNIQGVSKNQKQNHNSQRMHYQQSGSMNQQGDAFPRQPGSPMQNNPGDYPPNLYPSRNSSLENSPYRYDPNGSILNQNVAPVTKPEHQQSSPTEGTLPHPYQQKLPGSPYRDNSPRAMPIGSPTHQGPNYATSPPGMGYMPRSPQNYPQSPQGNFAPVPPHPYMQYPQGLSPDLVQRPGFLPDIYPQRSLAMRDAQGHIIQRPGTPEYYNQTSPRLAPAHGASDYYNLPSPRPAVSPGNAEFYQRQSGRPASPDYVNQPSPRPASSPDHYASPRIISPDILKGKELFLNQPEPGPLQKGMEIYPIQAHGSPLPAHAAIKRTVPTQHNYSVTRRADGTPRPPRPADKAVKEAEVDKLTDMLIKNMEASTDPDYYGMCAKCGGSIMGEESGCTALDQVYHVTCFKCVCCDKLLKGSSFFAMESKPYCEDCYLNTLEKCCVCSKPITDRILRATGKPYHPQCFTCVVCGKSLDGIPFTVDATNQIHCIEDFHHKFAPRCSVCQYPIMPDEGLEETIRIVALDRSFHVKCYQCEDCGLQLSSEAEGRGCYPLDEHILCKSCNAKRIQAITGSITTEL